MGNAKEKIAEYRTTIRSHAKHISELQEVRRDLKGKLALLVCPFNVGDRVISRGDEVEITRITPYHYDSDIHEFDVHVKRIKKDGSLYANEQRVWWPEELTAKPAD